MLLSYDILVTLTLKWFQSGKYSVKFRHLYLTQYCQLPPEISWLLLDCSLPNVFVRQSRGQRA